MTKFTIELDEFWYEADSDNLEPALKRFITNEIVQEINQQIGKQIKEQIKEQAIEHINRIIPQRIEEQMSLLIATNELTINNQQVKIQDHIKAIFMSNQGWNNPVKTLQDLAKAYGTELKKRYDAQFASSIVQAMHENKLLKDETILKLLEKTE